MKEVVWTFPYWIDNFPGLGSLIWKARHLKWLFALHFGFG